MINHLNVSDRVRVDSPSMPSLHGRVGVVKGFYGMVGAAGIRRVKIIVEFPHNRTKTKTMSVAMEVDSLRWPA